MRERRLERVRTALAGLREQAARRKLSRRYLIQRATRILIESKAGQYISYVADKGSFIIWLRRDVYRQQRRHDGLFVLRTNHPEFSPRQILDAYLQLQEIERCFRLIKSVVKVRPMYHHRQRRVETHVFLDAARVPTRQVPGAEATAGRPGGLNGMGSGETHRAPGGRVRLGGPGHRHPGPEIDAEVEAILKAVGIQLRNPVLRVPQLPAA